jgi:hypothetical protein
MGLGILLNWFEVSLEKLRPVSILPPHQLTLSPIKTAKKEACCVISRIKIDFRYIEGIDLWPRLSDGPTATSMVRVK